MTTYQQWLLWTAVGIVSAASFGCTAYFLYTWFDGGADGTIAATVGVGFQLFAYTLPTLGLQHTADGKWHTAPFLLALGAVPLLFSVASTIGTLQGAFDEQRALYQRNAEIIDLRQQVLNQAREQQRAFTDLGRESMAINHLTSAERRLERGQQALRDQLRVLDDLKDEATAQEGAASSILSLTQALASSFGGDTERWALVLIIVLAVAFDMLPVCSMVVLNNHQHRQELATADYGTPQPYWRIPVVGPPAAKGSRTRTTESGRGTTSNPPRQRQTER